MTKRQGKEKREGMQIEKERKGGEEARKGKKEKTKRKDDQR